ncbi:hypothetical protein WJX82_011508 [Trebouxia sp. C0006]
MKSSTRAMCLALALLLLAACAMARPTSSGYGTFTEETYTARNEVLEQLPWVRQAVIRARGLLSPATPRCSPGTCYVYCVCA